MTEMSKLPEWITAIGTAILIGLTCVLIWQGFNRPTISWLIVGVAIFIVCSLIVTAILNFKTSKQHPPPTILAASVPEATNKIPATAKLAAGQAALLWLFAAHAKHLARLLEGAWYHWDNAGEKLIHPVGSKIDIKNFGGEHVAELVSELRDFRALYEHHLAYVRSEVPAYNSQITSQGFPCEREYHLLLADLQDHSKQLDEAGTRVWESERAL